MGRRGLGQSQCTTCQNHLDFYQGSLASRRCERGGSHSRLRHHEGVSSRGINIGNLSFFLYFWTLDAEATLGRSGNQVLGINKMIPYPTVLAPPQYLRITIMNHCLNLHTPWAIEIQAHTLQYRILGHPASKAIDLQIPTTHRQTCIDTILVALRTVRS